MRKATMLVIKHIYRDEDAIQTVLRYAMDSRFLISNKIYASGVRTDCFNSIVEDFHKVQEPYTYLKYHRKLMHFVLTTTNHATKERTLDEGAYAIAALLESMGHQFVMAAHRESTTNPEHYHWHVVINVKSYTTGETMLDKYSTYNMILKHLNNNPHTMGLDVPLRYRPQILSGNIKIKPSGDYSSLDFSTLHQFLELAFQVNNHTACAATKNET